MRPAEPGDREDVWHLLGQLAISHVPERAAFDPSFHALLADGSSFVLIADDGGTPAGYLIASLRPTLIANGPEVWVGELVVDESARGRGIGTALMHAAEECGPRAEAPGRSPSPRAARNPSTRPSATGRGPTT
nr:GNAT family N-acetyltransferase [Cellulomonas sp. APG4]